MEQLQSPVDILKLLPRTNCRDCHEATCLAFAAAVFKGQRQLSECPYLEADVLTRYSGPEQINGVNSQSDQEELLKGLQQQIRSLDLESAAKRTGGTLNNGRLTIRVLGKEVSIDTDGNFFSDIHIHGWVTVPMMVYILEGQGKPLTGSWLPFRELPHGKDWQRFFEHRCEKPLKKVADLYTDLFADMLHIFQGKQIDNLYGSDISLVLYPLPKLPILICYWRPEDGMESSIHLFFDSSAEDNLKVDAIYLLCTGLVIMFEKIALTHG